MFDFAYLLTALSKEILMQLRLLPFALIPLWALMGCSGKSVSTPTPPPSAGATQSVSDALKSLVAAGSLPTLDVSTSVLGTDADGDGVRDDLDKYIAGLQDTEPEKRALLQLAAAVQSTLAVDTTDGSAVASVSYDINQAVACTFQQYTGGSTAQSRAFLMEELTMNTMPRIVAYSKYNAARNGSVTTLPSGNSCK